MKNETNQETEVPDNYYVDPKEFHIEMVTWVKQCEYANIHDMPRPRVTESIGHKIYLICTNLGNNRSFYRYTWKDLMIGDAIEKNLRYIHNYKYWIYKNPYSYVNFNAYRAFIFRINAEKVRLARQKEYIQTHGANNLLFTPDDNSSQHEQIINDKVTQFFDNGCYQTKVIGVD